MAAALSGVTTRGTWTQAGSRLNVAGARFCF